MARVCGTAPLVFPICFPTPNARKICPLSSRCGRSKKLLGIVRACAMKQEPCEQQLGASPTWRDDGCALPDGGVLYEGRFSSSRPIDVTRLPPRRESLLLSIS